MVGSDDVTQTLIPYWKIQMTSEEVLLVLVNIKTLRHDVCSVQGGRGAI